MDDELKKLENCGKNIVDALTKRLKYAKIIDGIKVTEEKARELLTDVNDQTNVTLEKFKEALTKLASEQKKNIEDLCKSFTEEAPKLFMDALKAGASAFKDTLTKKD